MVMIKLSRWYDYGHELRVVIGSFGSWNAVEFALSHELYWDLEPRIGISVGVFDGSVFSLSVSAWNVHTVVRLVNYRYPIDLDNEPF